MGATFIGKLPARVKTVYHWYGDCPSWPTDPRAHGMAWSTCASPATLKRLRTGKRVHVEASPSEYDKVNCATCKSRGPDA